MRTDNKMADGVLTWHKMPLLMETPPLYSTSTIRTKGGVSLVSDSPSLSMIDKEFGGKEKGVRAKWDPTFVLHKQRDESFIIIARGRISSHQPANDLLIFQLMHTWQGVT